LGGKRKATTQAGLDIIKKIRLFSFFWFTHESLRVREGLLPLMIPSPLHFSSSLYHFCTSLRPGLIISTSTPKLNEEGRKLNGGKEERRKEERAEEKKEGRKDTGIAPKSPKGLFTVIGRNIH
jgi:hypothetical protein